MKLRNSKKKELIRAANKFQPWDYAFLLELEYQALKVMYNYFSGLTEPFYCDKVTAKNIKIAIKLLDIILERDSALTFNRSTPVLFKYVNTRNYKRFIPVFPKSPCLADELRITKAWHLYNLLRFNDLRHWWY